MTRISSVKSYAWHGAMGDAVDGGANVGEWQQPRVPLLTVSGSTPLVFSQELFPSKVAYREQNENRLFWDLSYFWDKFREQAEWSRSSKFVVEFKRLAIQSSAIDELHVRGKADRLGCCQEGLTSNSLISLPVS